MRKITLIRIEMTCRVSSAHSLFECERGDELRVERHRGDVQAEVSAIDADRLIAEGYAEDITPSSCHRHSRALIEARAQRANLLIFEARRNAP